MRICKKEGCNNEIPKYYIKKDGKRHNLQRRRYCFECSPFGEHNTRNLDIKRNSICKKCGGVSQKGRSKCYRCYFSETKIKKMKKVYSLIGYFCWKCNYNKGLEGVPVLEFHHIDPKTKLTGLTTRELVGRKWKLIREEMQKCVSLCCRCHREYHAGLIPDKNILKIYEDRWKEIGPLA